MGPSWYWMPDVFESFYNDFGKTTSDFYKLDRLDPGYQVVFGENERILIGDSLEKIFSVFEKEEKGSSIKLKRFINIAKENYNIAIVCAGTSDMPSVSEAHQTLISSGQYSKIFADLGVAGLWRIHKYLKEIKKFKIIIVAAGMDGALPSVLGGLVAQPVIAIPTSTGYGVSNKGNTALNSMLASCSPGITVVNIDNGYGAAMAAVRILLANI